MAKSKYVSKVSHNKGILIDFAFEIKQSDRQKQFWAIDILDK